MLAAVTAVTYAVPRPLTAVCTMTLPMAVMEYCSPMGRPITHRWAIRL